MVDGAAAEVTEVTEVGLDSVIITQIEVEAHILAVEEAHWDVHLRSGNKIKEYNWWNE